MDTVAGVHRFVAGLVLVGFFLAACLGGIALQRGVEPGTGTRRFLAVLAAVLGVQALLGITLALGGRRPSSAVHFAAGPLTLFAMPLARAAVRGAGARSRALAVTAGAVCGWVFTLVASGTGGIG